MRQWRYYEVLVPGISGFWEIDSGAQARYETKEAALARAAFLWRSRAVSAVEVHEKTDAIVAVWPQEEETG